MIGWGEDTSRDQLRIWVTVKKRSEAKVPCFVILGLKMQVRQRSWEGNECGWKRSENLESGKIFDVMSVKQKSWAPLIHLILAFAPASIFATQCRFELTWDPTNDPVCGSSVINQMNGY